ncbi:MAG: hypothetical protein GY710_09140 [Desulfobacteraceae bacterium]|nr:hypothetical protein [Desulfobacteraceae bacterium]
MIKIPFRNSSLDRHNLLLFQEMIRNRLYHSNPAGYFGPGLTWMRVLISVFQVETTAGITDRRFPL